FFSSRRRHTRSKRDWSSDVCSSDLNRNQEKSWSISSASGRARYPDRLQNSWLSTTPTRCPATAWPRWRFITGGYTDETNATTLCSRHHTAVHLGKWTIRKAGGLTFCPPAPWLDPSQPLLRNAYWNL